MVKPNIDVKPELLLKTPTLAYGFLTLNGFHSLPLSDSFYLTNDIVTQLPKFNVIGRKDFQFQSGSKLISPEFIEQEFKRFGFNNSMIVIPKKHDVYGFVPVMFLKSLENVAQLHVFSQQHFPKFMQPTEFLELPSQFSFGDHQLRQVLHQYLV